MQTLSSYQKGHTNKVRGKLNEIDDRISQLISERAEVVAACKHYRYTEKSGAIDDDYGSMIGGWSEKVCNDCGTHFDYESHYSNYRYRNW